VHPSAKSTWKRNSSVNKTAFHCCWV
jgi:hypothetical protein